jgi:hypothetical protein
MQRTLMTSPTFHPSPPSRRPANWLAMFISLQSFSTRTLLVQVASPLLYLFDAEVFQRVVECYLNHLDHSF